MSDKKLARALQAAFAELQNPPSYTWCLWQCKGAAERARTDWVAFVADCKARYEARP